MQLNSNKTIRRLSMKIAIIFLMATLIGCSKAANEFQMTVDQVDELQGMILKGISISGAIENGCIANDDEYVIHRAGKQVHTNTARILNIRDLKDPESFNGQAITGDYVTLYIPDGKKEDVNTGDVLSSAATSCDPNATL